jgi:hypothetical protein
MVALLPTHRPSARRKNACSIFAAGPKEVKSHHLEAFFIFLTKQGDYIKKNRLLCKQQERK